MPTDYTAKRDLHAKAEGQSDLVPSEVHTAVDRGWSVIPLGPDKKPLVKWKPYQERAASHAEVAQWAKRYKPSAWGVVTGKVSGIVVLDFDGGDGLKTLEALGLKPHVRTPSGAYHVYCEYAGFHVPTLNCQTDDALKRSFPGMDIRGDGGYAAFWGEVKTHDGGNAGYQWLN